MHVSDEDWQWNFFQAHLVSVRYHISVIYSETTFDDVIYAENITSKMTKLDTTYMANKVSRCKQYHAIRKKYANKTINTHYSMCRRLTLVLQPTTKPVLGRRIGRGCACVSGGVFGFVDAEEVFVCHCWARFKVAAIFLVSTMCVDSEALCVSLRRPNVAVVAFLAADFDVVHTVTDRFYRKQIKS